jgi:3-phosphoglycerate kinase
MDGAAGSIGAVENGFGLAGQIMLAQRLADIDAARGEKGVGHAAADDQVVDLADEMILDIGPAAVEALADVLKNCRTLVWNGPLGAFETPPFDAATVALAKTAAALTKEGSLVSVAGGGDTVAALNHAGVADGFTFVSTAGGAFLEWMEGKALPGVKALERG